MSYHANAKFIGHAKADRQDMAWLKKIAEGYFKRYGKDKLEGFLRLMDRVNPWATHLSAFELQPGKKTGGPTPSSLRSCSKT